MAETGAIRAGGAFVEIFAKDAKLMKALSASSAKFKAWGASMVAIGTKVAAAGAAATTALFGTMSVYASDGDKIAKASQRTGLAVEALSELGYAAEQSGLSFEQLENSIRFFQKQGGDASVSSLKAIADELVAINDPSQRAARAMELFGRSGTAMIPMMIEGGAGMQKLMDRAKELGLTMESSAAYGAVEFGDNMADVGKQVKKVAFEIGAALAPTLKDMIANFQKSLTGIINWIKENQALVSVALKAAAGVTAIGVAMVVAGYAMKAIGVAIAGVTVALSLLTSPIAVVSAAIAALGVVVLKQGGAFSELKRDAVQAFEGIKAALMDGDVSKAAGIMWKFIALEFQRGIHSVQSLWFTFTEALVVAWANVGESIQNIWSNVQEGIENTIHDIMGFIDPLYDADQAASINAANRGQDREGIAKRAAEMRAAAAVDHESSMQAAEERLRKAQAELREASKVATKAMEQPALAGYVDSASQAGGPGGLGYKKPGVPDAFQSMVRGIFNPRAIQSLQGSRDKAQKPVEKKLEQVVEVIGQQTIVLETIEKNTRNGSMEFE